MDIRASITAASDSKFHWEISSAFQPLLARVLDSPGEPVTNAPLRRVTRHAVGENIFYLKTYFHDFQTFAPLKYFFKKPASRAEWHLAPQLQKLGIPVVPHLAHGERWAWRGLQRSILITEGPPGFVPLKSIAPAPTIQSALGKFLRELHGHCVFHNDLHISNLLYSPDADEFCLVDLDNMEILPALSQEQRMDNLATLNRRWPLTRDFYLAYDAGFLERAGEISERADHKHRSSIPKKLKLLFDNRPPFTIRKTGNLKWHVRQHPRGEILEEILREPDEFLAGTAQLLKNGTRSTVGSADGFVLKRFNFKKFSTPFLDVFRSSRARHSFVTARHLELLKISTPRPVAYADFRRLGFVTRGYFVMEKVAGASYLWKRSGQRQAHLRKLAELIAKIHEEGFSHRDLKETNIVVDENDIPFLIDLDAMCYVGKISNARAAEELARLAQGFARRSSISKKERLRFLKIYCATRKMQNWRWWWNEIAKMLAASQNAK
jgi:tRNA A-37 threonylcarbamoyl transferase component Bud32